MRSSGPIGEVSCSENRPLTTPMTSAKASTSSGTVNGQGNRTDCRLETSRAVAPHSRTNSSW